VRVVRVEALRQRAEAMLPPGWLAALRAIPGRDMLAVLDYRLGEAAPVMAARCRAALEACGREIALGVAEAEDHPCQLNLFLDVVASRICLPVDVQAAHAVRLCAPWFAPGLDLVATQPFPFYWREWAPVDGQTPAPFILELGLGALRAVRPGREQASLDAAGVMLLRESPTTARQVVAVPEPRAAVGLFLAPGDEALAVLPGDDGLGIRCQGDMIQAFPLLPSGETCQASSFMALHSLERDARGLARACLPALAGPFLLQAFVPSRLPETDIEFPSTPRRSAWEISCSGLERRVNGAVIAGRQAFPEVYVFTGLAMGLSPSARVRPEEALDRQDFAFFPCDAGEAALPAFPPSSSDAARQGTAEAACPDATCPEAACTLAEMARQRHEAACLRFRLGMEQDVLRYAGVRQDFLPYKARSVFVDKQMARLRRQDRTCAAAEALTALLEPGDGPGGEALEAALEATAQGGLPKSWQLEATFRRLHDRDFAHALRPLDRLYDEAPGLGGLYSRLARERCLPTWRHGRAAALFKRERERGWMPAADGLQHAVSLATLGRLGEAEAMIAAAYARDDALRNGFADAGWGARYWRSYEPSAVMAMMERDKALGRLGEHYVSRWATMVAALGDLDAAVAMVRDEYDRRGRVADGGFSRVGWEYHVALRQDPESVWPYFALDEKRNNKNSFRVYFLGALAATGRLAQARDEAALWYRTNPRARAYYSVIGLVHWLAYGDDAVLRELLLLDYRQETGTLPFDALLLRLIETRGWPDEAVGDAIRTSLAEEAADAWAFARQLLRLLGFDASAVRRLLPGFSEVAA
jgi:hypothetical protein